MRAARSTWNPVPRLRRISFPQLAFGVALALLAAGPALLLAPPRPARADDEAARFIWSRYASGQYRDAIEAARAILEDEPTDADAIDVLASALESTGEEVQAEKDLRALAGDPPAPTHTAALLRLGEHLAHHGRSGDALAPLRAALEKAPPALEVRIRAALGEALADLGKREEAEGELRRVFADYSAIPDKSFTPRDWIALARAALAAERIPALVREHVRPFAADARNFFQKAYEADTTQADTLALWGRIYLDKWDLVESKRLAKEALKRNARHAGANALLAELALADFYGGTDRYEQARRSAGQALATDPGCPEAHIVMAELAVSDGLLDDALASCDRALLRRPLMTRALGMAAAIRALKGDAKALETLEKTLVPRGTRLAAEALAEASALQDRRFGYRRAYDVAKRALEVDPECIPARRQLGFAAMRVGDEATARKHLAAVHEADPFDLFTFNQLNLLDYLEKEFTTDRSDRFILRVHRSEAAALRPYVKKLLERAWDELSARYGVTLDSPIIVEVFPNLNDFSVRAIGHRFIPASGVTFARVIALASPTAFPPGTHGWGRVLWHELAHVATLERSDYKVPRWLTEGISVYEESKGHPAWLREWDVELVDALARGRLLPIEELNGGFSKPRFPNQVMLSYYQGGLICGFIEKSWGFPALLAMLDGYKAGLSLPENLARSLGGVTPQEFDRRFMEYAKALFASIPWRPACADGAELAELRRSAKAHPRDAAALARYALGASDLSRWADAEVASGELAQRADAAAGDALLVLARIAEHRGRADLAADLAAQAVAADTSDPLLANYMLAAHYAEADPDTKKPRDLRKAVTALETLHRLFPRHPGYVSALFGFTADKERGMQQRHLEVGRELAALQPDDFAVRVHLVGLAKKRRDLAEEAKWLEELLWIDPLPRELHREYARVLRALGRGPEADFEAAIYAAAPDGSTRDPETAKIVTQVLADAGLLGGGDDGSAAPRAPKERPAAPTGTAAPPAPPPTAPAPPTSSAEPKRESF